MGEARGRAGQRGGESCHKRAHAHTCGEETMPPSRREARASLYAPHLPSPIAVASCDLRGRAGGLDMHAV